MRFTLPFCFRRQLEGILDPTNTAAAALTGKDFEGDLIPGIRDVYTIPAIIGVMGIMGIIGVIGIIYCRRCHSGKKEDRADDTDPEAEASVLGIAIDVEVCPKEHAPEGTTEEEVK